MLPDFITETERFATLEGNVGRKVTRYIDQLFEYGVFAASFDCLAGNDLVDFALFVQRLQKCKEALSEDVAADFSICIQSTIFHSGAKVVVIPLKVPECMGMRDKQALLANFAYIMRRFVAFAMFSDRECLDKCRREQLGDRAFALDDVQYTYLTELVSGNYTHLEHTGMNFMSLAIALNPSVDDELRLSLARDSLAA